MLKMVKNIWDTFSSMIVYCCWVKPIVLPTYLNIIFSATYGNMRSTSTLDKIDELISQVQQFEFSMNTQNSSYSQVQETVNVDSACSKIGLKKPENVWEAMENDSPDSNRTES